MFGCGWVKGNYFGLLSLQKIYMRVCVCPLFSFWIPTALDKICFSLIASWVMNCAKIPLF